MPEVFNDYAKYYDLLYSDKDYPAEASYVNDLIKRFSDSAHTILELGSGTGKHAALLAEKGHSVCGVERSDEMLEQSIRNYSNGSVKFKFGDVRSFRAEERYDVVMSLFHVMCYQTTNADLLAAFETASHHLKKGGVFIFDFWYGPAVLNKNPEVRVKRMDDEHYSVVRIAEPELYPNENAVNVNFEMMVTNKSSGKVDRIMEKHRMRYLFMPEIELFFQKVGLIKTASYEWMTMKDPSLSSWNVCVVARRNS